MTGLSSDQRRSLRQTALLFLGALFLPWLLLGRPPALAAPAAQSGWTIGSNVGLAKGTQIRVAPGLSACYHTVVPEDNWTVQVINGPRTVDGRPWYDTSRRAAGDPSGGTGWVDYNQATSSPAQPEGTGAYCPPSGPQPGITPTPPPPPPPPTNIIEQLITWWLNQPLVIKILVIVVAFVLIPASDRLRVWHSTALLGFVRAVLWGIVLGGVADLTRSIWWPYWERAPQEWQRVDPALLLLFAPLGVWAFGYLAGVFTIALAIGLLLLVILALFLYVYALASLVP